MKIKRCPFCGGIAAPIIGRNKDTYKETTFSVYCENCKIGIYRMEIGENAINGFQSPDDAIKAWNKRYKPTTKREKELIDAGLIYPKEE